MRLIFGIALLALAAVAIADVGPGPSDLPGIAIYATIDGAPVPNDTTAQMHCFVNGQEFMGPTAQYECTDGVCMGSMYKLCPCGSSGNATFEFSSPSFGMNYTTAPPVLIEHGNNYYFNVTIRTNSRTAGITGTGSPQPPAPCGSIFILLAALLAVPLLAVKR